MVCRLALLTALCLSAIAPGSAAEPEPASRFVLENHSYPGWVEDWACVPALKELWLATPGGLLRFDCRRRKFLPVVTTLSGLPGNSLREAADLGKTGAVRGWGPKWYVMDPRSGRFSETKAPARKRRKGEVHWTHRREFPEIRKDQESGSVTFEDKAWSGGVLVGKVTTIRKSYGMGFGKYRRETGTVLVVSSRARGGLKSIKKKAAGDFERIRHIISVSRDAAYVLTSLRSDSWAWKDCLYRVDGKGWSRPLLSTSYLKGYHDLGAEIWLVGSRCGVWRLPRRGKGSVEAYPRPKSVLRAADIGAIAPAPGGIYLASFGYLPWAGGLTFYNSKKQSFVHYYGKLYGRRWGQPPPEYKSNTPLPCNYLSGAAWDGKRLWVLAGGQGSEALKWAAGRYVPFLGLLTFDGRKWKDRRVTATRLGFRGGSIWYYVPSKADFEKGPRGSWFLCGPEAGGKPRAFVGNARLNDLKMGPGPFDAGHGRAAFAGWSAKLRASVAAVYDRKARKWTELRHSRDGKAPGVLNKNVRALLLDGGSKLWIAGYRKGVERHDLGSGKREVFNFGQEDCLANCLARYKGCLLVGLEGPPLAVLDIETGRYKVLNSSDGISGTYVHHLAVSGEELWVGTRGNNGGLTRINLPALIRWAFPKGKTER